MSAKTVGACLLVSLFFSVNVLGQSRVDGKADRPRVDAPAGQKDDSPKTTVEVTLDTFEEEFSKSFAKALNRRFSKAIYIGCSVATTVIIMQPSDVITKSLVFALTAQKVARYW